MSGKGIVRQIADLFNIVTVDGDALLPSMNEVSHCLLIFIGLDFTVADLLHFLLQFLPAPELMTAQFSLQQPKEEEVAWTEVWRVRWMRNLCDRELRQSLVSFWTHGVLRCHAARKCSLMIVLVACFCNPISSSAKTSSSDRN